MRMCVITCDHQAEYSCSHQVSVLGQEEGEGVVPWIRNVVSRRWVHTLQRGAVCGGSLASNRQT